MRKRNQLEQLSAAEERMKITVKTMEQLMQAVNNTMKTHENTVFVSEVYNTVLNTRKEMISRMESEKREILQKKLNKTLDLATLVIPNEIEQFKMITNDLDNLNLEKEREIIKKIAFMQRKITIYANTHQSEIPLLNEEVQKLKSMQITINNQNQLLQNIERIQKMYEVFGGFVKVEELEALY